MGLIWSNFNITSSYHLTPIVTMMGKKKGGKKVLYFNVKQYSQSIKI